MSFHDDIAEPDDRTRIYSITRLALTESQRRALRAFAAAGFESAEDLDAIAALRRLADALEAPP